MLSYKGGEKYMNNTKALFTFKEYIKKYDNTDLQIKLKIAHMYRVMAWSKKLSQYLNLPEEDIALAELIGLLHDIGRFEQIKNYHTFIDKNSINHAEYGIKILFDNNLIEKFTTEENNYHIIKQAILNHNRNKINTDLTPREQLHSKIIRDADKTDILYLSILEPKEAIWGAQNLADDTISDAVYRDFFSSHTIDYRHIKTPIDNLICHFAYIFDYNYTELLKEVKENQYLEKIYHRFKFNNPETQEKISKIYTYSLNYLNSSLDH